jgi:Flp pilus assembly protein TadG
MPIFVALLVIVADASMLFGRKADVLRIVQDANRAMSIGRLREIAEAEDYVTDRIDGFAPNTVVAVTILDGVVRTEVTIPAADLTSGAAAGVFNSLTVRVSAEHMLEA